MLVLLCKARQDDSVDQWAAPGTINTRAAINPSANVPIDITPAELPSMWCPSR